MNKSVRKSLFYCLFVVVIFVLGCQGEKSNPAVVASGQQADQVPVQQIWDMKVLKTDSGNIVYRMYAGYAKRSNPDMSQSFITDFDSGFVVVSYKKGRTFGRLNSIRGIMDDYRNVWTAIDSVVLNSPTGYKLYTDRLIWNINDKKLFSETPVLSVRGLDSLWGDGFFSTENLDEYNIINPRGKAFLPDEKVENAKDK